MSHETTWICDGCDRRVVGDFPITWAKVKITVGSDKTSDLTTEEADLCDDCRNTLGRNVHPSTWPRPALEKSNG